LPSRVEEKPHCGDRHSWSMPANLLASSIRRLMSSFASSCPFFAGHEAKDDVLSLRQETQRLEPAGALVVVLHEVAIDGQAR